MHLYVPIATVMRLSVLHGAYVHVETILKRVTKTSCFDFLHESYIV
jgi:hypothetical protein